MTQHRAEEINGAASIIDSAVPAEEVPGFRFIHAHRAAKALHSEGWVRVDPEDPDTVERLARVLYESTYSPNGPWIKWGDLPDSVDAENPSPWCRNNYRRDALAVLRALRGVSQHPTGKDPQ